MQFGPLGKDAGHRRLNVAITRAREQVDVVSSVLASDFRVADQMKTGVRLLRDYIGIRRAGPDRPRSQALSDRSAASTTPPRGVDSRRDTRARL